MSAPLELEGQLPGQVVPIVQTGVQAFTTERAGQMTGVAEEEAPTIGQVRGHPPMHAERCSPADVAELDRTRDSPSHRRGHCVD